ncbi:Transposase [Shewanella violacea]
MQVVAAVEKGVMTYKQAQSIYGIQGRSTVLTQLRKHGKMNWTQPLKAGQRKKYLAKKREAFKSRK